MDMKGIWVRLDRQHWPKWMKNRWVSEIVSTGTLIIVILMVRSSLLSHYNVPTGSMIPTIIPGDHFIGLQYAYGFRLPFTEIFLTPNRAPQVGDVAVFPSPVEEGIDLVKRVVAVGGDTIEVRDGFIYLNGRDPQVRKIEDLGDAVIYEENLGGVTHPVRLEKNAAQARYMPEVRIPEGEFFAMGDNRDNSGDSRFFGPVQQIKLKARARWIIYSVDWGQFPWVKFSSAGKAL